MDKEFFEFKGEDRKYKRLKLGRSQKEFDFSDYENEEQFKERLEDFSDFGLIDACLPKDDKFRRMRLQKNLECMLKSTLIGQDIAILNATKKVKEEFSPRIAQLEKAIKKLDSQIFLEDEYGLITIKNPNLS